MKRIIVLIIGLVLLMLFTVAPAMAAPATRVPVHGGSISSGESTSPEMWLTNGDITQMRGGGSQAAQLELYIYPSTAVPDYVLTVTEEYDAMVNWKTGEGVWRFTLAMEYFESDQAVGAFKGQYIVKSTGAYLKPIPNPPYFVPIPWTHLEGHAVLQGDGIFDGQTLMLDFERTRPNPGTFEGFLLTP